MAVKSLKGRGGVPLGAFRNQTVTVIPTTAAQNAAVLAYLQSQTGMNSVGKIDNCAVRTNSALGAAGINTGAAPFPGRVARGAMGLPGAQTFFVPQGGPDPRQRARRAQAIHTSERAMTKDPAFPRRVYRLTTIGWCILVLMHLSVYIAAFLRAGPTNEVYANSISFQILAFCLTVLPYWLLLLLTVLIVEFATVGRLRKPKEPS